MTRRQQLLTVAVLAMATLPLRANAQTITLSETADGSSCYLPTITGPSIGTAYIILYLQSLSPGITGAEFRVTGLPPDVVAQTVAHPIANLVLGDPFGSGCNIAFPGCQMGTSGVVLLYTVSLLVASGTPAYVVQVEPHATPSSPTFGCPLVTLCDAPVFTKHCVLGGQSGPGPLLATPVDPVPANGAAGVATNATLAWERAGFGFCCGIGTAFTNVYLGTASPPPFVHQYQDVVGAHDPGPLAPRTTYYWRIATTPDHDCGIVSGSEWSFSTGDEVPVDATTWQAVKGLYR